MNKTEKELKASRDQLLAQLKDCDDKLDAIKAERRRKAEIKRTYKPNHIEPEYELDWRGYAITLETSIDKLAQELPNYNEIREFLTQAKMLTHTKFQLTHQSFGTALSAGKVIRYLLVLMVLMNLIESMQLHALNAISLRL